MAEPMQYQPTSSLPLAIDEGWSRESACIDLVALYALAQRVERVVAQLVVQLVQKVDLNAATVAAFAAERVGPVETVGFEQHTARLLDRGPHAKAGHAGNGFGIGREAVHLHDEDAHGRRALVGKAHIERAKAELAPEFAAVHHMAADAVRPTEQGSRARHVAGCQRIAHG